MTSQSCVVRTCASHHPTLVSGSGWGAWFRFLVKFQDAIGFSVPNGYQDETGFHFGREPVPDESDPILVMQN